MAGARRLPQRAVREEKRESALGAVATPSTLSFSLGRRRKAGGGERKERNGH